MRRFSVPILALLALALSVVSLPQRAQAETENWTGCPYSSTYSVDPGPRFSVSWVVSGERAVIAFQKDHIRLGGGKGSMTQSELNRWKPILDELRTAAASKVKVTVYYDDATRHVIAVNVRWDQPC